MNADANNFIAVRLLLATSVIYTHCYFMSHGVRGVDDLSGFLGATISTYAVDGFFFLSGFLVYPSLLRLGSAVRFATARFVRLWPGLALCILLTVLAGGFFTTAPAGAYLGGDTARFILTNLTFTAASYQLTGVDCGGETCVLNGSLWTLPWEVRCYAVLAILGALGLARPAIMKWLVLPLSLVGVLVWDVPVVQETARGLVGDGAVYLIGTFDRLWAAFALGVAAYLYHDRIPLSWWGLGALFVLNLAVDRLGLGLHMRQILIGYAVLCCGFLTAQRRVVSAGWPDYSYGMYIYGYPVMVALYAVWPTRSHLLLTLVTMAATVPLAALSWHMVERPALDAHRRHRRARALTPQQT
ncbi:acyltransferase [Phenylobacterium sp.]|uniref:acyltransferase family protein n=1 Tax=Phenylobacterium sp. TaxID=1871053 RepID=UPI0028982E28|nr:acyltransferase [Phenylobacterium sp.]